MTHSQLAGLLQLPAQERLQIVADLWNSLVEQPDAVELPTWQATELDRRLAEYEADPEEGLAWAEVQYRIVHGA